MQILSHAMDIGPVTISPGTNVTRDAGENLSLECSVEITPNPLPQNVPHPTIDWFFGLNNASLPSGVTPMATVMGSGNTYSSMYSAVFATATVPCRHVHMST